MQYGIPHEDIYNFDETGFAMGLVATTEEVTIVTRTNTWEASSYLAWESGMVRTIKHVITMAKCFIV
jgi:hypothetical protein